MMLAAILHLLPLRVLGLSGIFHSTGISKLRMASRKVNGASPDGLGMLGIRDTPGSAREIRKSTNCLVNPAAVPRFKGTPRR